MGKAGITAIWSAFWRSPAGVLTRLELIGWRGWLREARKDLRFGMAAVVIAGFALMAVQQAIDIIVHVPWAGVGLAVISGASLFRAAWIVPGSRHDMLLCSGLFQPWTSFGPFFNAWKLARATMLTAMGVCGLTIMVAIVHSPYILPFLALAASGAALRATLLLLLPAPSPSAKRRRRLRISLPKALPAAMKISLLSTFRRRIGGFPLWMLSTGAWALGTPASAMTSYQSGDPHIGFALITIVGVICGLVLAWPNIPMLRFLAYQSIAVKRIVVSICLPQVLLVAVAATLAAFGCGQPVGLAFTSVAIVITTVAIWLALLIPYALTQSVRAAPAYALRDIGVAGLIKFSPLQFGFLAVGWLVYRIHANIRAIPRKRWKEPL